MIKVETLELPGEYRYFSPRIEKMLYGAAIAVAIIYTVVDYFIVTSFFTPTFRFIAGLAYLYPLAVMLITGMGYFIKDARPFRLLKLNYIGLIIFLTFHFFPFFLDKDYSFKALFTFLVFQILICGPFIATQILVLYSFALRVKPPALDAGVFYAVKQHSLNTYNRLLCISFACLVLSVFVTQSPFMFIIISMSYPMSLDLLQKKLRKIYVQPDGLVLLTARDLTSFTWKDISRLYLQRGFLNVKKVTGAIFIANNGVRVTVNKTIENYRELIPLIISKCTHIDQSITDKLLKGFREAHA